MKLFRMMPVHPFEKSEVEGKRLWHLPNIKCSVCPLSGGPMRSYPCVTLIEMDDVTPFLDKWPVSVERFQEMARAVRPFIPSHLPIFRSTGLGPWRGKADAKLSDYAVAFLYGAPLFEVNAFERMCRQGGFSLQHVPAAITSRYQVDLRMVELQIDGFVSLAKKQLPAQGLKVCALCERNNIKELRPEWIVVRSSSIPQTGEYFGLIEFPTIPIVSDRFRIAAERANVSNVRFDEIEVVEE
jgi:uncharacterized double-CXXCG motif protein